MDTAFRAYAAQYSPAPNKAILNGYSALFWQPVESGSSMLRAEEYVQTVYRDAFTSNIPGLEYLNFEHCSPREEFLFETGGLKSRGSRRQTAYELARTDIYLVRHHFTYKGVALEPIYQYLPYISEFGLFYISGVQYQLSPVLADIVLSPTPNGVFVQILSGRVAFHRQYHTVIVNHKPQGIHFVHGDIYKPHNKGTVAVPKTATAHYLFARLGVRETFKTYLGFEPIIGEGDITPDRYPDSKWVICQSSTSTKPRTVKGRIYHPPTIRLAIPIEHWTESTRPFVAGLFYLLDHFPTRLTLDELDNVVLWKILLGHIVYRWKYSDQKALEQIENHYRSLDTYLDPKARWQLEAIDIRVRNFYDLLATIVMRTDTWIGLRVEHPNNLYGKTLEVLRYALSDLTDCVFWSIYELENNSSRDAFTPKEIEDVLLRKLRRKVVTEIRKHPEVAAFAYAGDLGYFKATSTVVPQVTATRNRRKSGESTKIDASYRLHSSYGDAGSVLFLSKSHPTPDAKINLFANIDPKTHRVVPNPNLSEIVTQTQKLLSIQIDSESDPADWLTRDDFEGDSGDVFTTDEDDFDYED